jgi:hypothetical protein
MKCKSLFFPLLTLSLILSFYSCKKSTGDNGGHSSTDNNPLVGTWILQSENWQVYETDEFTDGGDLKSITSYNSSISNPVGTFTFTDSTVIISNYSYSIASNYADYEYKNHVITDSAVGTTNPRSLPDTGMTNNYRFVGADSIIFPQGSAVLLGLTAIGSAAIKPCGGSFAIGGNRLTLTSIVDSVTYTMIYSGTVEDTLHTNNRTVAVFTKQ